MSKDIKKIFIKHKGTDYNKAGEPTWKLMVSVKMLHLFLVCSNNTLTYLWLRPIESTLNAQEASGPLEKDLSITSFSPVSHDNSCG